MAFQKGVSGNPAGSTGKEKAFRDALRIVSKRTDGKDQKSKLMQLAEKLFHYALEGGQGWAFQQIADRLDGKPAQAVEVSYDDRTSIEQFSDAELTAIMRGRMAEAAAKTKPPAVNADGNAIN